jgi:hypothetical protein
MTANIFETAIAKQIAEGLYPQFAGNSDNWQAIITDAQVVDALQAMASAVLNAQHAYNREQDAYEAALAPLDADVTENGPWATVEAA